MIRVIIDSGTSQDVITTIAIGEPCFDAWQEYALPTWKRYCERHGLGLIAFDADLIPKDHAIWKKPTWQKLLVGQNLREQLPNVRNVCNLATDILINYTPEMRETFEGFSEYHQLPLKGEPVGAVTPSFPDSGTR